MKRYTLKNGLKIIESSRDSDIVTIQATVKVGSNNESSKNGGISHFVEHMVFEGTKTRASEEIANSIEGIGGDISAFTSNEVTGFYVKILKKHFEKALEILSDILLNPVFDKKIMEKERKVILSEIRMVIDQPRNYQWVLFCKTLFDKFPAKNPIYGNYESVSSLKREDLVDYHKKYYTAPNTVLSVVGNVPNLKQNIEKYFGKMNNSEVKFSLEEEKTNRFSKKIEKRKINQSYIVLGYKTPKRDSFDSYVLDVIRAVLGRGLSGTLFREIRSKRGLAYDVGIHNDPNIFFGIFAAYFSTNKKNIPKCIDIALKEFSKLRNITQKELLEAKQFIEGEFFLDNEDSQNLANNIGFWEFSSKAEDCISYVNKIKKVTKNDVSRVVEKYLNKNYSLAIVEQK